MLFYVISSNSTMYLFTQFADLKYAQKGPVILVWMVAVSRKYLLHITSGYRKKSNEANSGKYGEIWYYSSRSKQLVILFACAIKKFATILVHNFLIWKFTWMVTVFVVLEEHRTKLCIFSWSHPHQRQRFLVTFLNFLNCSTFHNPRFIPRLICG